MQNKEEFMKELTENDNLVCRKGKGIKLFINKDSNYGLTHFEPVEDENDPRFQRALRWEKFLEDPEWVHFYDWPDGNGSYTRKFLTRKQTETFYHYCVRCKAEKINNFERYCRKCEHYYKNQE